MLVHSYFFLGSDFLLYIVFLMFVFGIRHAYILGGNRFNLLYNTNIKSASLILFLFFFFIAIIDSIHFTVLYHLPNSNDQVPQIKSLLDLILAPLDTSFEETYSAPFAHTLFNKEFVVGKNNVISWVYPKLIYVNHEYTGVMLIVNSLTISLFSTLVAYLILKYLQILKDQLPGTLTALFTVIFIITITFLSKENLHVLGTDKVGQDVLYMSLKSIRTSIIIGTVTTLITLPFALCLGTLAGYFRGIVDDIISYIYTLVSSIPSVLLIAASLLIAQVILNYKFETASTLFRSDVRLVILCIVLGLTSWTGLCRLVRAETLKIREMEYVQASRAMGASHFRIIYSHIVPNLFHIITIAVVFDFSGLVLAEAVLSYVGVGVSPDTYSFGNMINAARMEMAKEPVIYWTLLSSFTFMATLVLVANIFADAMRDVFDPKVYNVRN